MPETIRILMADDSAVVRRLLTEVFNREPGMEVVGAARNGRKAVDLFSSTGVDVVVLDVEMPEMDGVEALIAIRKIDRGVPIIMFSSLTTRGAESTLDALLHGANDYVTKPTKAGHLQEALADMRTELVPKIQALVTRRRSASQHAPARLRPRRPRAAAQIGAVTIGVSTGGPNALAEVLGALPADLPVPVLIVQHMPPTFTTLLAQRLNEICPLEVREATKDTPLEAGHVWIAPGGRHLAVVRKGAQTRIALNDDPPEHSCRPAVDVLFRSAAATFGSEMLAVVLTGMGKDGLAGCQTVKARGGQVIVQDQSTSVVWGMPRAVEESGFADRVLPLGKIAREITTIARVGR